MRERARHGLIDRHDLVAELDRATEKKVTAISAPAGSGKTTLLRLWADRARDRRIAVMSVRPGQEDVQQFWLALLAAVRGDRDVEPMPGFDGSATVAKALSEFNGVLVIDDLHELDATEALDQLASLLTNLPSTAHAIVASRHDPPLRLHRLRLTGELAEIRAARLRFTGQEALDLVAAARIRLPDHVTAVLHQRTEGWAAGLRLAVLSLAGHPDPEQFVAEFSGSDRTVAEYLMAEMLARQPAEVQRLLLRTAVLDRVNSELADLLTSTSGSARILLDLEDANAFVVSLDPDRTWFRYHHLFAGLLRLELRRTQAGEIPALHRLAARWFAEHAQPADAIRHLQAAGDWTPAARLLADHALSMTLDGQAGTVVALLRAMPVDESPELALVYAIADLDQMRLSEAAAHLEVARPHARLRTAVTALDLLLARLRGHFDGVCAQVDAIPSPMTGQSNADISAASDLRAVALLNLGVTEAWSLRLADSEKHLSEGAALAHDIGRPYLEVACLAHLGFAVAGRSLTLARQRCEEAIALATRHGWDTEPVIAPAHATLAGILIWTGEFDHGEEWLNRAMSATQSDGEPGIRLLVHLIAACLHAARGQHHQALAEFVAAGQVPMVGQHALADQLIAWTIATQARCGMLDEARAALTHRETAEIRNAAAAVRLAEEDPAGARGELPVPDGTALTRIETHLLDALACHDLGDQHAASAAVERALDLAERDRLILPFSMTRAWELLESLRGSSHAAFVADILDAVHDRGAPGPAAPRPAEDLSPSELRVLRYLPTNLTRPEIAGELSVSVNTVNTHIRRIYAKLGATDRSSAVRRSRELRLLASRG